MKSAIVAMAALLVFLAGCSRSSVPSLPEPADDAQSRTATSTIDPTSVRNRSVVKVTDAAIAKFKEVLAAEPKKHIRLAVKSGGSTGFMYDLQVDDTMNDSDFVDDSNGFRLVVDPKSSIYLEGATIDWQTQADGTTGFKFHNPNAVEQ